MADAEGLQAIVDILDANGFRSNRALLRQEDRLRQLVKLGEPDKVHQLLAEVKEIRMPVAKTGAFKGVSAIHLALVMYVEVRQSKDCAEILRTLLERATEEELSCKTELNGELFDLYTYVASSEPKRSVLLEATLQGHLELVETLLRCRVDPNFAGLGMSTPLHFLSCPRLPGLPVLEPAARTALAQRLIDAGADVDGRQRGWTALMVAALFACQPMAALLMSNGANVNLCTADGLSALDIAQRMFRLEGASLDLQRSREGVLTMMTDPSQEHFYLSMASEEPTQREE